ncbi:glutathione S-transferase L3-like [Vigna umbellata]|uniref:glutathione S-transferase L3-like n=1 Tax=Vigna umbellata TaxID=87088 RepID=UPI001F5FB256|nr:glutathione S-transferase L3-like [Vigna umbellata]
MSKDLSEGEKGNPVSDASAHGDANRARLPRISSADAMETWANSQKGKKLYIVLVRYHGYPVFIVGKYVDANFEGTPLFHGDPAKKEFGEQLLSHVDTFNNDASSSLKGGVVQQASYAFDYLENALGKFDDGPFFLGQFSLVDIAYIPFVERFQPVSVDVFKHDITEGRPKLATWIEEVNKIDAYTETKLEPQEIVDRFKKRYLSQQ